MERIDMGECRWTLGTEQRHSECQDQRRVDGGGDQRRSNGGRGDLREPECGLECGGGIGEFVG